MTLGPPYRRRPPLLGSALTAIVAVALSACGGDGAATAESAASAQPEPKREAAVASRQPCPAPVTAFVDSLDGLRRQLAVGLSYGQYAARIDDLHASYDRLPIDRLGLGCLTTAGAPAERAFNEYLDATNAWGRCLADASCSTAAIEPVLQRRWRQASGFLTEADRQSR
jgi:hypothetical protein